MTEVEVMPDLRGPLPITIDNGVRTVVDHASTGITTETVVLDDSLIEVSLK